ncbi:methyltransferase-like protein 27 [Clytia hemisphaerica]|uniref:methyltransferase-like protein 27 n=1 Tax=Clytia hemisphaerica TaxID=252671 RepID=UPI0034D547BB
MEFYKDYKEACQSGKTEELYEKHAMDYDESVDKYGWSSINEHCANLLSPYLTGKDSDAQSIRIDENEAVLDLGCGTGISGMFLQKLGFRNIIGIDGSQEMIEQAQSKNLYRKLYKGKLTEYEDFSSLIEDSFFRSILCVGCISVGHIRITDFLPEISRILKDGGIAVYTVSSTLNHLQVLKEHFNYLDAAENSNLELLRIERKFYFKSPDGIVNYCYVYVVKKI